MLIPPELQRPLLSIAEPGPFVERDHALHDAVIDPRPGDQGAAVVPDLDQIAIGNAARFRILDGDPHELPVFDIQFMAQIGLGELRCESGCRGAG